MTRKPVELHMQDGRCRLAGLEVNLGTSEETQG